MTEIAFIQENNKYDYRSAFVLYAIPNWHIIEKFINKKMFLFYPKRGIVMMRKNTK